MTLEELRASSLATITLRDAASLLGVDARTVSAAARAGEIPAIHVGRRVLIPRHRFIAYLDGAVTTAVPDPPKSAPPRTASDDLRARLLAVLLDLPENGSVA